MAHIAETKRMTEASTRYSIKKRALESIDAKLWQQEVQRFDVEEARRRRLDELEIQRSNKDLPTSDLEELELEEKLEASLEKPTVDLQGSLRIEG